MSNAKQGVSDVFDVSRFTFDIYPPMTDTQLLQEFEALAERLGVRVSREDLEGRSGGLCTFRGERRIILDRTLDVRTQVEIFTREFARLPLDDLYIVPRLRERIDAYREAQV